MSFTIRPFCHFPVQCFATYIAGPFRGQGLKQQMAEGNLVMCNHRKNHFRRRFILVTLLSFCLLIQHQALAWQTVLNNPDGPDLFRAVAIDSANNVIAAGTTTRLNRDRGFVVAKLSGLDGSLLWRVEIDGMANGDDDAFAVAVDSNDDVLAVGHVVRDQDVDFIVTKLAGSDGAELWRRILNGPRDNTDVARSVAIDRADDVVVAGVINDAITSGNFAVIKFSGINGATQWTWTTPLGDAHTVAVNSQNEIIAGGSTDGGFTVVKIDSNGGLVWRQEIPHSACCRDNVFSVAIDSHDDVFAAGSRQQDFATVKLSGVTGAVIWSRQINGTGISGEQANRVAVDPNDDVVVAGFINKGATSFDWDFTVIKFAGMTGITQWSQTIDGGSFGAFDEARDVVIDGIGDVYVTGDIATDAFGAQDLAVVKLAAADGSERWRHMVPLRSRGNAIALDSANNVVAAGEFFQVPGDPDLGAIKRDGPTGLDFPVPTAPTVTCVPVLKEKKAHPAIDKEKSRHGLFQVSASDTGSAFTITLGSIVLANGEIIKITSKPKPGVNLVGTDLDNEYPGRNFRHFHVGPGEALIVATDAAGNMGSAVCPVP